MLSNTAIANQNFNYPEFGVIDQDGDNTNEVVT